MKKIFLSLTAAQQAELAVLPDGQIDTRDVPEQIDWGGAWRGVFLTYQKTAYLVA